jgi:uncharacterized protein (TIRG00374 family)
VNKQVLVKIVNVLKYVLGPVVLIVVVWLNWHKEVDSKEVGICRIFEDKFHFDWVPLTLAFVICLASMLLTFVRWFVLVRAQDLPFTLNNAVQLGFIGSFFSAFLPGSVTGDIPKMVFMARDQRRRNVAVATIIIDRVMGLCGLIWLTALLGAFFWFSGSLATMVQSEQARERLEIIVQVTWLLTVGSLAFWFLLGFLPLSTTTTWIGRFERIPKLGHTLAEMCRATLMYRSRGTAVALSLLLAMIGHAGFVLTFYCGSVFVNPPEQIPSWGAHFLIVPVGMTFQAGMPTPGGIGFGEWAFGGLYAWVGGVAAEGIAASILRRLLELLVATLGFVLYWRMKPALQAATGPEPAPEGEAKLPNDELQPVPN